LKAKYKEIVLVNLNYVKIYEIMYNTADFKEKAAPDFILLNKMTRRGFFTAK